MLSADPAWQLSLARVPIIAPQAYIAAMAKTPIRPTDDAARVLARSLMTSARFAALGVLHPDTGAPHVSRIAFALGRDGQPISLVSTLSLHTRALQSNPVCSLLVGEPPATGNPLAFARLSLTATAEFIARDARSETRDRYLKTHPKAQLYVDFADFGFVRFAVISGALNGGFGKAYDLSAADLAWKNRG